MADELEITINERFRLPPDVFEVQFARSGGPGGQNVNKVSSKVDLRLDLEAATPILGEAAVRRIREKLANRLDAQGRLQIQSSEHREQGRNIQAALARTQNLIEEALKVPKPRRKTRPTRASKERRIAEKKRRSERKKMRGRIED